jgi:hypothetical protein
MGSQRTTQSAALDQHNHRQVNTTEREAHSPGDRRSVTHPPDPGLRTSRRTYAHPKKRDRSPVTADVARLGGASVMVGS